MKIKWYAKIHIDMREREKLENPYICMYVIFHIRICNMYVFEYVGRESET